LTGNSGEMQTEPKLTNTGSRTWNLDRQQCLTSGSDRKRPNYENLGPHDERNCRKPVFPQNRFEFLSVEKKLAPKSSKVEHQSELSITSRDHFWALFKPKQSAGKFNCIYSFVHIVSVEMFREIANVSAGKPARLTGANAGIGEEAQDNGRAPAGPPSMLEAANRHAGRLNVTGNPAGNGTGITGAAGIAARPTGTVGKIAKPIKLLSENDGAVSKPPWSTVT